MTSLRSRILLVMMLTGLVLVPAHSPVLAQSICNVDSNTAIPLQPGQTKQQICGGRANYFVVGIAAGEKAVALSDLPADYDLQVYSATQGKWIGASENGNTTREQVRWTLNRNEVVYVVVIPWDTTKPYTPYVLTAGRFPQFRPPVDGIGEGVRTPIGSPFHKNADEYALDFRNYSDSPMDVYPTYPGRVVFSGCLPGKGYGCVVVVRHWDDKLWDRKFYSIYAHLDPNGIPLPPLWTILDGTRPLGSMGRSGLQDVVHLHFAVRYSNDVFDKDAALYGQPTSPFDARALFH